MSSNASSNKPTIAELHKILTTGKSLDQTITKELGYPDLTDLFSTGASDAYTTSFASLKQELVSITDKQFPEQIKSKIDETRCRSFVGILKEIKRAWISLDHCLYLWDYNTGGDICEYVDQDQPITAVGLVKPKPGVFNPKIDYLLIVATALQIIPLGISVSEPTQLGEQSVVNLIAVNLAIPSDDISMRSVVGTADGRIFMVGSPTGDETNNTGHLYELVYNVPTKWTGPLCQLVCRTENILNRFLPTPLKMKSDSRVKSVVIDSERRVLYILNFDSSIEVVYIGTHEYTPVIKYKSVIEHAQNMCRQHQRVCDPEEFLISSLHIIPKKESQKIYLMAMTTGGFRLYFSGHANVLRMYAPVSGTTDRPSTLELVHVRFPPAEANLHPDEPKAIYHTTYYSRGTCISAKANKEFDSVHITALASVQQEQSNAINFGYTNVNRMPFIETAASTDTKFRIAAIDEIMTGNELRELAQQLSDPQRTFVAVSIGSICAYHKKRPVDILERLIANYRPSNESQRKEIMTFFDEFGKAETCAMCLSIICDSGDKQTIDTATYLFFEYGGVPAASKASQVPNNYLAHADTMSGVTYSGKHDGFVLFLARLLGPIWTTKLFVPSKDGKVYVNSCNKEDNPFITVRRKLLRLKTFMDAHKGFHDPATISDPRFQTLDSKILALYLDEQRSVHELYLFLLQCIDSIEFSVFLWDANTRNTLQRYISVDTPSLLKDLDIKMMLTMQEGRDFCHELVITAVDEVTVKNAAAFNETVSTDLQQRCPVFFSRGDFFFFRGVEYIRRALHEDSENEKRYFLQQSLSQFQQASDQISEAHISSICSFYQAQSFHVGVVELMLDRAQKLDPQQQALAVFESGGQGDEASKALYDARTKAYNYIFLALKDARSLLQPKIDMSRRVPIADKAVYVKQVFESALQNKDPLFHYKLYYWYINENMTDELLAVDTEFLVPFFSKVVQDEYISLNFLWQYYRGKTQFYKSAICLTRLAEMPSDQITLEARMKYLAYARVNCRCGEKETDISNYTRVQLAERIDTCMNTCRLQIRIQNILKNSGNIDAIAAAKELDYQLFDDERKLYSYAERFPQLQDLFKSI